MKTKTVRKGSRVTPRFLPLFPREKEDGYSAGGIITLDGTFTVSIVGKNGKKNLPIIMLTQKPGYEYDASSFLLA